MRKKLYCNIESSADEQKGSVSIGNTCPRYVISLEYNITYCVDDDENIGVLPAALIPYILKEILIKKPIDEAKPKGGGDKIRPVIWFDGTKWRQCEMLFHRS